MVQPKNGHRKPNQAELQLLSRLLSVDFPGKPELLEQSQHIQVRTISEYPDNWGSLELIVDGGPAARVNERVPVYAEALDEDGINIEVLLHVLDGKLNELEIYKVDGSPLKKMPSAEEFVISVR